MKHDIVNRLHFDETSEKLIVESVQDCTPVLEQATRLRNEGFHGSKEMRHVAKIPKVIVEKYCNDAGITLREWMINPVHVERMLKDRDLSGFRVGA